jgi:hypothetical protein
VRALGNFPCERGLPCRCSDALLRLAMLSALSYRWSPLELIEKHRLGRRPTPLQ